MHRRSFLVGASFLAIALDRLAAESLPRKGTFTGYFFVDRWGQGWFDFLFVAPELKDRIPQQSWRPIKLTTSDIHQIMNPGAGLIRRIDRIEELSEPTLQVKLSVDRKAIAHGQSTTVHVLVENHSDSKVELYRRDFRLLTTVHRRGEDPAGKVDRDEIYDCFNNPYGTGFEKDSLLRATMSDSLFTNDGRIKMFRGAPTLQVEREGMWKRAELYDEEYPVIPPRESVEFAYAIGEGWLINEYELQIRYCPREEMGAPYVLSPPLSFDVKADATRSR